MADYPDPTLPGPANNGVAGDTKAMPDRGTSSGFVGKGAPYGASVDMNATNRMGSAHTDGDPPDLCYPKGDAGLRFNSSGHSAPNDGQSMSGTGSDPADEVMPDDTRGSPDPDAT